MTSSYVESKKERYKRTCKTERDLWTSRTNLQLPVHPAVFKVAVLYRSGGSAPCSLTVWMGGESGGEWTHAYEWQSPSALHLKVSQQG